MFRVPCNFVGSRRLSPVGSDIKILRLGRKGGFFDHHVNLSLSVSLAVILSFLLFFFLSLSYRIYIYTPVARTLAQNEGEDGDKLYPRAETMNEDSTP